MVYSSALKKHRHSIRTPWANDFFYALEPFINGFLNTNKLTSVFWKAELTALFWVHLYYVFKYKMIAQVYWESESQQLLKKKEQILLSDCFYVQNTSTHIPVIFWSSQSHRMVIWSSLLLRQVHLELVSWG